MAEEPAARMAHTHTEASPAPARRDWRVWVALLLALVLAAAAGLFARGIGTAEPLWVLGVLGALSFVGLLTLFGALIGMVHVGRLPGQRAFYESIIDAVADSCVVTDRRGRVIYANAPYRALVHGHGRRLVGIENLYAGYPDIAERVYRLAQAARDGTRAAEEFRLNPGSGAAGARADRPVWVQVSVDHVEAGSGEPHTLWRHRDVTADRERQEAAFAKLQFIISYLDRAPAGFFSTDAQGAIAYVNATLAEWLGLDLARTTDGSLKLSDILSPADARLVMSIAARPGSVRTEAFDLDLKASEGGQAIPVRIIHRAECGADGNPEPSRSLVLDRRLDGAGTPRAVASDQFQRLVNHAPVGMAMLDRAGIIVNANGAFVALSEGNVRGAPLRELVGEAGRADLDDAVSRALAGEAPEPLDVSFAGPSQHTGQLTLHRLDPPGNAGPGVFVFALDTTKHSSLEVQLVQSQKMQAVGQLAGGMAHDFNNVLTAIIGFSDLLLARHRPTDPAFADIMNIKQNANRAANLVRQLLAFSRRQTLRPEVLSLTDILSDLGHLLGRLLGEKVELKVIHGRDLWPVKVDVNQFEQVIINLAVNGRDAMPDGGILTVRTANVTWEESKTAGVPDMPPGEYVLCEVADTGTGMSPDVIAKMYEPFFSTKDVGKGTGLGLSTVYGIVRQTGGYIFCDSEVGKGTRFCIYLPRHAELAAAIPEPREEKRDANRTDLTGRGTILLVEDEDAVRSFASRALASRGYTVLEAESGERALELVDEGNSIDLVVSDVVMPVMDGPTLLKELRQRGVATKIVFISGYAEDAFARNLEGESDFAFLPKPFSLKQLAEAVKEAMD
jgi:two-component system, cell cycle sensor histidine kinase and response regulator CckA